jgi:hypothetical protein
MRVIAWLFMKGVHTEKVAGGKLVRIKAELDDDKNIRSIQLLGDFFIYPEEFVSDIETFLKGADADSVDMLLVTDLNRLIEGKKAELIGVTPEAIIRAFKAAVNNALSGGE